MLAAAGLLDGRRATTHWSASSCLGRAFPRVQVEPDAIWVEDGGIYTSAGVTAGMDLALALVEEDHGRTLALDVARQLVLFLKRPGGQRQFSTVLAAQSAPEGALAGVSEWLLEHLGEDLRVERLAERAAMSPRNFARVFARELGTTPAKFVERAARRERTPLPRARRRDRRPRRLGVRLRQSRADAPHLPPPPRRRPAGLQARLRERRRAAS